MNHPIVASSTLLTAVLLTTYASATEYYFGPTGSSSAQCTKTSPCALNYNMSGKTPGAGEVVYLLGGTYSKQYLRPKSGGSAGSYLEFRAADGELPILDGGGDAGCGVEPSAAISYVRFIGIVSRNWQSSGFSNGYNNPSSKIEFINCIADGNGINGITFYKTTGVLIQQSIAAHNGNQQPSWSSGINLFTAGGSYTDNIVRQNVSFENIDISSHHSDGNGFILDQSSTGALFENNIGFRNGGSCIRLTNSSGAHIINNTCFHDGLEPSDAQGQPSKPGEIYFSDATTKNNAILQNNLAAASGYGNDQTAFGGQLPTSTTNYTVNANGATPFFADPAGTNPDFRLTSAAESIIVDKGTASGAPTEDIGFDPKCIQKGSPGGASWWSYVIDYDYIKNAGGIAACFKPGQRSGNPDIGAYEYNSTPAPAGGAGSGGAGSAGANSGGTNASGGTTSATSSANGIGGSTAKGGATASSGGTINPPKGGTSGVANGGTTALPLNQGGTNNSAKGGTNTVGAGGTSGPSNVGGAAASSPENGGTTTDPSAGGHSSIGGTSSNVGSNTRGGAQLSVGGNSVTSTTTAPQAGGSSATATGATAGETGSCSCRIPAREPLKNHWLVGLGVVGLLRLRRRWR